MGVNQGVDLFKALQWVHKYKISIMFPLSGALRKPNFKYYLTEKLLISQSDFYPKYPSLKPLQEIFLSQKLESQVPNLTGHSFLNEGETVSNFFMIGRSISIL